MNKFASGLLAGGVLGMAGLAWAMSDGKTRKRMARQGREVVHKANEVMENVQDMF
jgi:urease gamma subunit